MTNFPAKRHAMIVTGVKPDADALTITIDHDARASYSRAVQPRAMREAKSHIRPGEQWELHDANYDEPSPHGETYGRSVYYFRRSTARAASAPDNEGAMQ